MDIRKFRIPKLSHHKGQQRGYVNINRKPFYLPGKWPRDQKTAPKEIRQAYRELIEKMGQRDASPVVPKTGSYTIVVMVDAYLESIRHRPALHSTMKGVVKPLLRKFGNLPADEFRPEDLEKLRSELMSTGYYLMRKVDGKMFKQHRKYTRTGLNHFIERIRKIFRWAFERGRISQPTISRINAVHLLQPDHPGAPESPEIRFVPDAIVEATLPHLHPILRAMVQVQRFSGCRASEVIGMTMSQIDRTDPDCWVYIVNRHKTQRLGKLRFVPLGPRCQEVLQPFLREDDLPLFSPAEKTGRFAGKRRPGLAYTLSSYAAAIRKVCAKHGLTAWTPRQLRKTAAQRALEAKNMTSREVADLLGHSSPEVTKRFYLEAAMAKIRQLGREFA